MLNQMNPEAVFDIALVPAVVGGASLLNAGSLGLPPVQ